VAIHLRLPAAVKARNDPLARSEDRVLQTAGVTVVMVKPPTVAHDSHREDELTRRIDT
jgi:hypothetical protein